jgi:hypothetical protein
MNKNQYSRPDNILPLSAHYSSMPGDDPSFYLVPLI